MALHRFGFIVKAAGLDPDQHRVEMTTDGFTMVAVGVSHADQAPVVATSMQAEGVQLIELCGGFGPAASAAVMAAVGPDLPVGTVTYGPDAIDPMHALFA
ncbi:MAG: DUF6506 family protein [Pseudooceanicola sp.]